MTRMNTENNERESESCTVETSSQFFSVCISQQIVELYFSFTEFPSVILQLFHNNFAFFISCFDLTIFFLSLENFSFNRWTVAKEFPGAILQLFPNNFAISTSCFDLTIFLFFFKNFSFIRWTVATEFPAAILQLFHNIFTTILRFLFHAFI